MCRLGKSGWPQERQRTSDPSCRMTCSAKNSPTCLSKAMSSPSQSSLAPPSCRVLIRTGTLGGSARFFFCSSAANDSVQIAAVRMAAIPLIDMGLEAGDVEARAEGVQLGEQVAGERDTLLRAPRGA